VHLGKVLKAQRRVRDLSVQELAETTGIRVNTIYSVLAGRNAGPNFFLVAEIALAIGLSLDELYDKTLR
jgi:transcriptional regulator with XRE-family HTH domain